jgi:hypothetical protein
MDYNFSLLYLWQQTEFTGRSLSITAVFPSTFLSRTKGDIAEATALSLRVSCVYLSEAHEGTLERVAIIPIFNR